MPPTAVSGSRRKHTPRASRVETAQIVLPGLTNTHGTIFGGMLMQWIDLAGAIAAVRHSGEAVVTAGMDGLHFLRPLRLRAPGGGQAPGNHLAPSPLEG